MTVNAITPDYKGEVLDRQENFGENQIVYVGWDHHLFHAAPFAFLVSPAVNFLLLVEEIIPSTFSTHPDYSRVDWDEVEWLLDGQPFIPQMDVSLQNQGINHKSLLRFRTLGLKNSKGLGV